MSTHELLGHEIEVDLEDDEITSAIRRSAEQVMAYHRGRPPQQYNTGGIKCPEPTSDE